MPVRYAKRSIYAQVPQEGVRDGIRTLVAVQGAAVAPHFDDFVDDVDTTTDPTEAAALVADVGDASPGPDTAGGQRDDRELEQLLEHLENADGEEAVHEVLRAATPDQVAAIRQLVADGPLEEEVSSFDPDATPDEEPLPGYRDMNVPQIVDELTGASQAVIDRVKAYEADHAKRKGVLEFEPKGADQS